MLRVRPLKRSQIARIFPLLLQVLPGIALAEWKTFAARLIRRSEADGMSGMIVVETDSGTIRGGFIYEVEELPDRRRRLVVRHVVIPPLGQTMVAGAIQSAVEEIVRAQACDFVHVELPSDAEWEADYFTRRGHHAVRGAEFGDAALLR